MTKNEANANTCRRLAGLLMLIPEFPRTPELVNAAAADLMDICAGIEEAEWLVTEARMRWPRWRGMAGLRELLGERRPPTIVPPERKVFDAGEKPPIACAMCQDFGYIFRSRYEYCSCDASVEAQELKLCEGLNEWRMKNMRAPHASPRTQAQPPSRPVTQEDLDKAYAERQDRTAERIAEARATLESEDATKDQREIAREILRGYGVPEVEDQAS